jgi:vacuolar-type H+-ATPase subunit I/STV1
MQKIKQTILVMMLGVMCSFGAIASELIHQFNSPAFNGVGYSSHVLTIEQLETNRRQKLKDDAKALADELERDYKATNAYKFQNNLESRIYATLSKQISDKIFEEFNTLSDETWYDTQTPFGDTISWMRSNDRIYVKILNSSGDTTAEFNVPVGDFAF